MNPNEELQHRLTAILREAAEIFPEAAVRDLCYGCGIDYATIAPPDKATAAPTQEAWMW